MISIVIILLLVVHYLICFALLALKMTGRQKFSGVILFIAFMIPVFGILMLYGKKRSDRNSDRKGVPIGLERRKDAETALSDFNRSIIVDNDDLRQSIVPLGEALVINDTATKRALIMDVLYSNPGDYVSQLFEAKANGDTEVVHYAATALTELQKEFDLSFQELSDRQAGDGADKDQIEDEYLKLVEKYVNCGILYGDALRSQLKKYSELLEKKLSRDNVKGRWKLINKKAAADLKLENAEALDRDVEYMTELWPERDGGYFYKIQAGVLRKDYELIGQVIREIRERNIYMSAELKSLVTFWDSKLEKREKEVV